MPNTWYPEWLAILLFRERGGSRIPRSSGWGWSEPSCVFFCPSNFALQAQNSDGDIRPWTCRPSACEISLRTRGRSQSHQRTVDIVKSLLVSISKEIGELRSTANVLNEAIRLDYNNAVAPSTKQNSLHSRSHCLGQFSLCQGQVTGVYGLIPALMSMCNL